MPASGSEISFVKIGLLGGGLENRRDYLSELGWSLLRRDVGSSICPEGASVVRPNGLPQSVRNIG
jgi:hypothetical protein